MVEQFLSRIRVAVPALGIAKVDPKTAGSESNVHSNSKVRASTSYWGAQLDRGQHSNCLL